MGADPYEQVCWYTEQGDRLWDIYQAASQPNPPLVTRERLVIASLVQWREEYNAEILSADLAEANVQSQMCERKFDPDEEGWSAERYPE